MSGSTGVEHGDTLALIDLGSGTVQTRLSGIFRDELDVDLQGIYLIASRSSARQTDRMGLVGPHWADERLIVALTAYIGTFEMMCTKAEASVIDYTADGEPVFGPMGTKGRQSESVRQMQDACLRFINDLEAAPVTCRPRITSDELARQMVADLARLIYLPSREEIGCLSNFEFDFNLGTDLMPSIADLEQGVQEFRREGFAMMNRGVDDMRISYPMEMRYMDMSLATTLMAAQRFGFAIKPAEAGYRRVSIPVLLADGTRHSMAETEAQATHDGYYVVNIPLSASFGTGVLLGQKYEWIQIDSIERVLLSDPRSEIHSLQARKSCSTVSSRCMGICSDALNRGCCLSHLARPRMIDVTGSRSFSDRSRPFRLRPWKRPHHRVMLPLAHRLSKLSIAIRHGSRSRYPSPWRSVRRPQAGARTIRQ
jgi:hypothetical protein